MYFCNVARDLVNLKRAARVILDGPYMSSTIQLFNRLKWLPFYEESKVNKAVFAFKSINGETAPYLRETLKLNREQHCRNTRYAEVNFICPKYKRETEGGRTFIVTTKIPYPDSLFGSLSTQHSNTS